MHAETVLLVDDRQRKIAERHFVLKQRVGADEQVEFAGLEPRQDLGALAPALAAGEDRDT